MAFCLRQAGITGADVDAVAYSFDPQLRRELFRLDALSRPGDWGSEDAEEAFLAGLDRVPERLSAALGVDVTGRIRWVPHHVAHAASAYYPSGSTPPACWSPTGSANLRARCCSAAPAVG